MTDHNSPQISFETFAQDHWTDREAANAGVVVDFFQHLMNDHDFDYVQSKFVVEVTVLGVYINIKLKCIIIIIIMYLQSSTFCITSFIT